MATQLFFFAVDVIGFFSVLLFGLRVLVTSPKQPNAQLLALICFNSACAIVLARQDYAFWIPGAYQLHVGTLRVPLHIARNLTPGVLMLLCHSLFQDESKVPRWLTGAFALQVLMEFIGALPSAAPALQYDFFQIDPALLQLLFVGFALYWMVRGGGRILWRRGAGCAGYSCHRRHFHILRDFAGTVASSPGIAAQRFTCTFPLSILQAAIAVLRCWRRSDRLTRSMSIHFVTGGTRPSTSGEQSIPAVSAVDAGVAAVQRAFADQHVYRDGELTVASLAVKLAMPEYRLRKLIHEQLGYRNFNALLHDYRIAAACRDLADPAKNALPFSPSRLRWVTTRSIPSIEPFGIPKA